jgi:hypothetical protein
MNTKLFEVKVVFFGGLSNETELAKECPAEFKKENKWSDAAMDLFFSGGNISGWKWKSTDDKIKSHQLLCFKGVVSGFGLRHEDKEAVAGWILSEMLVEVPEHVPAKKQ